MADVTLEDRLRRADRVVAKAAALVQAFVLAIDQVDQAFSPTDSIERWEALEALRRAKRRALGLGLDLVAFDRAK